MEGGRAVGMQADANRAPQSELLPALREDRIHAGIIEGERARAPTAERDEVSDEAQAEDEKASRPGECDPGEGRNRRASRPVGGGRKFDFELGQEREEGQGEQGQETAQGQKGRTGGVPPAGKPDGDHGEKGEGRRC